VIELKDETKPDIEEITNTYSDVKSGELVLTDNKPPLPPPPPENPFKTVVGFNRRIT
jgi:hypothetical protein